MRYTPGQLAGIVAAGGGGLLAAAIVEVAQLVDALITGPSVGDGRRADLDVIGDELMQRLVGGVLDDRHPAPTEAFGGLHFHGHTDQGFLAPGPAAGPAAGKPRLLAADEGLVLLYRAGKQLPVGPVRTAAGATSPTRSDMSRSPRSAAGQAPRLGPWTSRTTSRR